MRASRARALLWREARVDAVGVFALALAARLAHLQHSGGAVGLPGHDQSVYYSAAVALLHGRVPYQGDFVFLHPPGIAIVGLPFAVLGNLTTAPVGFMVESIAFAMLGAGTAALITVVARRAGSVRWAAVGGGALYATWSVTVAAGSTVRLEPLGDLLLVLAVYLLGPGHVPSRRQLVLAGVVFGLLLNVKLWWVVPIALVFLLTVPMRRGLREAAVVPLAAVVTAAVIAFPFLVLSRGNMFSSVVSSQLGRADLQATPSGEFARLSTWVRLQRLTGMEGVMARLLGIDPADADIRVRVVTLAVCGLVVLTSALALRTALGRVFVPVLAAQTAVLLLTPIYFPYYGDYVGVSLALVVAAAARPLGWSPLGLPWPVLIPLGAAFSLPLLLTAPRAVHVLQPPDTAALKRATRDIPCLVADSSRVLIALDAVDRSFQNGCRNFVDFQGVGHGGGPDPAVYVRGPRATPQWKRTMVRYLRSGDAVVLSDPNVRVLLGPAAVRKVTRGQLLASSRGVAVYRTG